MKNLKPIHVVWKDAESKDEWTELSEYSGVLPDIHTAGYLIKETKASLVIAGSIDLTNEKVSMVITIPKAWTSKIKKLRL